LALLVTRLTTCEGFWITMVCPPFGADVVTTRVLAPEAAAALGAAVDPVADGAAATTGAAALPDAVDAVETGAADVLAGAPAAVDAGRAVTAACAGSASWSR